MATRAWSNLIGALTFQRKSQEKLRVSPDPSSSSKGAGHETKIKWSYVSMDEVEYLKGNKTSIFLFVQSVLYDKYVLRKIIKKS